MSTRSPIEVLSFISAEMPLHRKAIEGLRTLATLPDFVVARLGKSPEARREGAIQRSDYQDDIEILCGTEIEPNLAHDQFAVRPTDQHILMFVARKMRPKVIGARSPFKCLQ